MALGDPTVDFFKGYIATRNKRPLQPFKDADLLTLQQAQAHSEYAGVLASNTVLIDVDNAAQADKLLEIIKACDVHCQVRKTDRGLHFYFTNVDRSFATCMTGTKLAIGVSADIKVGIKASFAVLKKDGCERPIIYDTKDYQEPPKWLLPIHTSIDLFAMRTGEGRNTALFSYILPLLSAGFTKSECRDVLHLINSHVLAEPLNESELATICRDEAFDVAIKPSFFNERGKFLFNVFADYLITQLHIKRVNGQLHMFDGKVYINGDRPLERAMLEQIPDLTQAKRREVLAYMEVMLKDNVDTAPANYIAFKNGILDINTGELLPFSPAFVITNLINHDYKVDAECELVDSSLNKLACNDMNVRALLEEMAGYCFYRRNELRKAFMLVGDKANGKSTFIAMLQTMVGDSNCASLDLKEVSERFKTAELYGKLVNLGDDIDEEFIANTAVFKKLVSGDRLNAERKGKDPFDFSNYSKFVFSANVLPRMRDKTSAVLDRLVIVPFQAHFSKDDKDYRPFIKYELCQEPAIERLIKLGVDALRRVLSRKAFTSSHKVKDSLDDYAMLNNPILMYLQDVTPEQLCTESVGYWHEKYHEFCTVNGITTLSRIEFSRQVLRTYPTLKIKRKMINGVVYKQFAC